MNFKLVVQETILIPSWFQSWNQHVLWMTWRSWRSSVGWNTYHLYVTSKITVMFKEQCSNVICRRHDEWPIKWSRQPWFISICKCAGHFTLHHICNASGNHQSSYLNLTTYNLVLHMLQTLMSVWGTCLKIQLYLYCMCSTKGKGMLDFILDCRHYELVVRGLNITVMKDKHMVNLRTFLWRPKVGIIGSQEEISSRSKSFKR